MWFVLVVFAFYTFFDLLPKMIFRMYPNRLCLLLARPFRGLHIGLRPLVAVVDGQARPMAWTFERGRGRVFASVPGHYFWTLDDPLWRLLCLRGMAWAGRRDPSSLNDAVMRGALVR